MAKKRSGVLVRLIILVLVLLLALSRSNSSTVLAKSESFPNRWSLSLEPPIMTEYGLGPNGAIVDKARIECTLTKNTDAISGTGGYVHSDCGLYRGGKVKGVLSKNKLKLEMRGDLELDLTGTATSDGGYEGEARVLDNGVNSKRKFRLTPVRSKKKEQERIN